ncbi:MAG: hypothetical protein SGJ27_30780 [Candidatus Melainabacteria bacterium]|nr:hypothetical protein [Candidatus Melainabacteria bacterium]
MDIAEDSPAAELSNFPLRPFIFRGLPANSMEGLLQALKFGDPEKQKLVMTLVGKAAKFKGKKKRWWRDQTLFWQGTAIKRDSDEFQLLLDEAFDALFTQNEEARQTLLATGDAVLTHTMGKQDPTTTVLTEQEFVSRLMGIRARLTLTSPE